MAQPKRRNLLSVNRGEIVEAKTGTKRRRQFLVNKDVSTFEKDSLTKAELNTGGLSRIQSLYIAGGVLDTAAIAIGTMGKASAIRAKGKFEEAAFAENERRLKRAADDARKRGDKDAAKFMKRVRALHGTQRAALGGAGIEIDRGTAADIQAETLEIGAEDASTIRVNSIREAFGLEQRAIEAKAAGRLTRIGRKAEERSVRRAGTLRTVSSIASTTSSISAAGSAGAPRST